MEEKRRVFYSVPVKAVVMVLCVLGFFLLGFCGVLLMDLAVRGVPLDRPKTAYENTEACGLRMTSYLDRVQNFYDTQERLNITYDSGAQEDAASGENGEGADSAKRAADTENTQTDKEPGVDIANFSSGAVGEPGDGTFYTLERLEAISGSVYSMSNDYVLESAEAFASNDAGVEVFSAYDEEVYSEGAPDSEDEVSSAETSVSTTEGTDEATDIYSMARKNQKRYLDEDSMIIVEPDGTVTNCEGMHFTPSQETIRALESIGCDYEDYSSQFLYLYEEGGQYETELPRSGVSLRDYAARNREVSLYDLYRGLYRAVETLSEYRQADSELKEETNIWYCVQLEDGTVYTNVDEWSQGYETAVSMLRVSASGGEDGSRFAGIAYSRQMGRAEFQEKTTSSTMMQVLSSWISVNSLTADDERGVIALNTSWPVDDEFSQTARIFSAWADWTPLLIGLTVAGAVLAVLCLILVTVQTGRNCYNREIHLYSFDRMPTEVYLVAVFLIGSLIFCLPVLVIGMNFDQYPAMYTGNSPYYYRDIQTYRSLFAGLSISGGIMLMMPIYTSLVRRIKAKNLWSRSLLMSIYKMCREVYDARKISQRILMVFVVYCLLQIVFLSMFGGFGVLLAVLLDVIIALYLVREAAGRQTIRQGLRKIGSGDLEYKIDLTTLKGDNLEMAETVNNVGKGLQAAIQEQMKSERLKADLITNVSHDIKTPLTSIINYVDLLKREDIQDPKLKGYIDILDSKSQRLKQLTEDLVEASKISSGNIHLEYMNLNFIELVQQVNGEFDERFRDKNLSLVCALGNEPLVIRADSRRIWRVLENLYVNVVKYAMPGTRVYVDVIRRGGKVVFSLKNISENPLNIKADELTERFIRGDVSRSTEGSGLGLHIAKNLTTLQHGTFRIYLDGDLFKVTISFDEVKGPGKRPQQETAQTSKPYDDGSWGKMYDDGQGMPYDHGQRIPYDDGHRKPYDMDGEGKTSDNGSGKRPYDTGFLKKGNLDGNGEKKRRYPHIGAAKNYDAGSETSPDTGEK